MENMEQVSDLVERECKKETNYFGYGIWSHHILSVVKYSRLLAKKLNANIQVVELAALLHDYSSIKNKDFYGPIESIIYSLFISIGFTITASILYVTGYISPIDNFLFLYIYGISNLVFAVILGFFVGLGKSRKNRLIDSMTGLLAASFFHGVLNFCILTEDYMLLVLVGIASIIISVVLIFKSLDYKPTSNNSKLI